MKIQTRLDLGKDIDRLNKIIYNAQKELKEKKKLVAQSHEVHGDIWETAKYDFIKREIFRKGYTVQDGIITKYEIIAK